MAALLDAAAEVMATLLRAVGFVGKPRRRAGIREDLALLKELDTFEEFRRGTFVYSTLVSHVETEVALLGGVDLRTKRRDISWSALTVAASLGAGLGYLTYRLNEDGFAWYSLIPGLVAALMGIAILGMFIPEEVAPSSDTSLNEDASPTLESQT